MAIQFLIDENITLALLRAIIRHNAMGLSPITATRVGEPDAPACGTSDAKILHWCEINNRVLVSFDKRTLPDHFAQHILEGHHCPGIFILKAARSLPEILEILLLASYASHSSEWTDRMYYVD